MLKNLTSTLVILGICLAALGCGGGGGSVGDGVAPSEQKNSAMGKYDKKEQEQEQEAAPSEQPAQ